MKLTKEDQRLKKVAIEAEAVTRLQWIICDAFKETMLCFEDCDEIGVYLNLLEAHFFNDELMELLK